MYIYPEHLKSKATIFLWELRNIAVLGILVLISVFAFSQTKTLIPLVLTAVYGFLTIQFEGVSILGFIQSAVSYFIFKQQQYDWRI